MTNLFAGSSAKTTWMAIGLTVSAATIMLFGYTATREWQRGATLLAERRAAETAALTVAALRGDMRAVQEALVHRTNDFASGRPDAVRNFLASIFARYPYPEWFFSWTLSRPDHVLFFGRPNRLPSWFTEIESVRFPVMLGESPAIASLLQQRIAKDAALGRHASLFEILLDGVKHQVIANLTYTNEFDEDLRAVSGFAVNLAWTRQYDFPALATQVARIGDPGSGWSIAVVSPGAGPRTTNRPRQSDEPSSRRSFPVMFFDPLLVGIDPPPDLTLETLAVEVAAADDPMRAINRWARWTFAAAVLAAAVLTAGVVLTARAVQGHAELAERRSELVSSVTHELKTPLATIRAVGDTLASGRAGNHETIRDYAGIVVEETRRLTRLVDTMLAYARITDVGSVYSFETISVDELIASTLKGFSNQLATGDFQVEVIIPPGLPPVRADRTSVGLLLDNVIDNAIRYSGAARRLDITARHTDRFVVVDISDHGIGITPDEIGLVTKKFFRGQRSGSGGSGLGLTIAHRIAADHGGSLTITSEVDVGTTVTVTLPIDQEIGDRS